MTKEILTGRCLCGSIQFNLALPFRFVAHCHCESCRRAHGAAFVTWAGLPLDKLDITSGKSALTRFESSPNTFRSFCSHCGSTLFYESDKYPDEIHIAVTHINEALPQLPKAHACFNEAVTWFEVNDDLKKIGC